MRWFDAGVNLFSPQFAGQEAAIVDEAQAAGIARLLLISSELAESQHNLGFRQQYANCYTTAGVHPHQAAQVSSDWLASLQQLALQPGVVAIGECGLDFNRDFSPRQQQQQVFAEQLQLAKQLDKAVYLHERDAFATQLAMLNEQQISYGIAHCFTGDRSQLQAYLDLGLYIGITGWLCDERRGQALQQAIHYIPADRLILETDAPYLLPRTVRPRPKRNTPALLPAIAAEVARLTGRELAVIAAQTYANSCRLFQLEDH
ncbi:TatD family hydrolase [Alishewanella sp. BS5-314]|uniref:TatD family hydrolase n=1 Tax=Alishewanella sp. BS5-314 TaxID=2755587 RepID=UPI0021BB74D9|nr:TatD family hydrolase [Alishewanella sp. BS5-314]MCT8125237.1 TatD family hydrolase [Alishewanella sp. BS5-314]